MRPLSDLLTRNGNRTYCFDGVISLAGYEQRVHNVSFSILSLDGYGADVATISDKIWIQSPLAEKYGIWYHLQRPAKEYARYHVPFLWLADFSKHFVEYLDTQEDVAQVTLRHFRSEFQLWLEGRYSHDVVYRAWREMYNFKTDYRTVIAANFEFLWKESVDVQKDNSECFLWKEVDATAVPLQPSKVHSTIVTPFVYECFSKMYFAEAMECRIPATEIQQASIRRAQAFSSRVNVPGVIRGMDAIPRSESKAGPVQAGDVVQLEKDENSPWSGPAEWYACVQSVETRKKGDVLRVIWMYWPEQTTCANMIYPHRRELFFSDHCNCGDPPVSVSEVLRKVKVKFLKDQKNEDFDFFVRQTYKTIDNDPSWITFRKEHLRCACKTRQEDVQYRPGQTVLTEGVSEGILEPIVVVEMEGRYIKGRRLKRRGRDLGDIEARANELVWTNELLYVRTHEVRRPCHVRRVAIEDVLLQRVPGAYAYNGTGDCWILTGRISEDGNLQCLSPSDVLDFAEGFDPHSTERIPLKGLSLFCGGGSFDRGFEESGAVKFTHSVDRAKEAIHTCRANAENPDELNLFYGNVNDWFDRVRKGEKSSVIPQVGSIGFMTAGSPCVAFSLLQPDKMSESSKRNASLVAALASAVDLFRPEYGVFENVFAMGHACGENKKENVLSQMICCFVGMGYQVHIVNQDAHSAGSGEQRSRLLICIAAPGLVPLPRPPITHSHPPGTPRRVIGKAPNGESFGERIIDLVPYAHVVAKDIIGDLPDIADATVNLCIPFPDHRVSSMKRYENWLRIKHIPRFPHGCSWTDAVARGYMPQMVIDSITRESKMWTGVHNKAYGRIYPNKSMPTIITHVNPDCAKNGRTLHYDQPRPLTVMEARRAQSYPDHEVLIGAPAEQWRIVGNSVDRKVSVAAGVSLRQAWMANDDYQPYIDQYQLVQEDSAIASTEELPVHVQIKTAVLPMDEEIVPITSQFSAERPKVIISNAIPVSITPSDQPVIGEEISATAGALVPSSSDNKIKVNAPATIRPPIKPTLPEKKVITSKPIRPIPLNTDDDLIIVKRKPVISRKSLNHISIPTSQSTVETSTETKPARQSLPAALKLKESAHDSRQSSADELGDRFTTVLPPPVRTPPSTSIFAKFRARERSPTTGSFLPRDTTPASSRPVSSPLSTSKRPLPSLTAIKTNGLISPPMTAESESPMQRERSEGLCTQPMRFASMVQKPSPSTDGEEDELSVCVEDALAVTSTAGLGMGASV